MKNIGTTLSIFLAFFYYQSNAQHTWVQQNSGTIQNLQSVDFYDEQFGVAVGAAGTILSTENGGIDWVPVAAGISEDLNGVAFAGDFRVFAVGNGGVMLKSEDHGQSWESITGPGVSYGLMDISFDRSSGHGLITGQTNAIIVSSDSGDTWTIVEDGYMSTFYSAQMVNSEMGVVMGWNSIFQPLLGYTLDWENWNYHNFYPTWGGVFYEGRANGGKFLSENTGYVVGTYFVPGGGFIAPFDGWTNNAWEALNLPEPLNAIDLKFEFGVVVGHNGYVAESTDGGTNWETVNVNAGSMMLNDVNLVGNSGYIVGDEGMLLMLQSSVIVNEGHSTSENLSFSPNPCNTQIKVKLQDTGNVSLVSVLNQKGQRVEVKMILHAGSELVLDVSELSDGMYILIIGQGEQFLTGKFSKSCIAE